MTGWIRVRVAERREAAADIAAFTLEPVGAVSLPPYEAGAHIDVKLPNGLIRQYSLCGEWGLSGRYEIGVLREAEGRGGSRYLHDDVRPGDEIEISPPRNLFPMAKQGRALLFAGGIGVTPILAMAEYLSRTGGDFALHYCTRSIARAAFRGRMQASSFANRVTCHFDDRPETAMDTAALLAVPEAETHLYVCGPDGFMDHLLDTARKAGWPETNIHFERFTASVVEPGEGEAFEIEVEATGQVVPVAVGQSALEALISAGFDIPVSCEQGICGTCLTEVVEGIPDHRDMYLTAAEHEANDCFTPCCSRALTPRLKLRL